MGLTHHYQCSKCEQERDKYDWWPNWFPSACPVGGSHDWQWKKREPVNKMQGAIDVIEKRQNLLLKNAAAMEEQARKEVLKGTPMAKKQAMALLKKKRLYEADYEKLGAQKANLEKMQGALEEAEANKEAIAAMSEAAKHMKGLTAERVDEDLECIRETMQQADEISDMLSQQLKEDGIDEAELMAEFNQLQETLAQEELQGAKVPTAALPVKVPAEGPAALNEEDEQALAALEAELAAA